MFDYFDHKGVISVYGWDAINERSNTDEFCYGQLRRVNEEDGNYCFYPHDGFVFTCQMMRQISEKLSELNKVKKCQN